MSSVFHDIRAENKDISIVTVSLRFNVVIEEELAERGVNIVIYAN